MSPPRRSSPHLLAVALLALAAAGSVAGDAGTTAPTAADVVARHVAAVGGLDALLAVRTLRSVGAFRVDGQEAAFIQERSRPGKIRFEFATPGEPPRVLASDGEVSWQLEGGFAADPDVLPPEQAGRYDRQTSIDGPLVAAWRDARPIRLVGRERLGDADVYRLRVEWANGERADLYVDAASHLLRRMDDVWRIGGTEVVIRLDFSDYRPVAGVLVPFRVEQRTTQGSWRFVVAAIDANVAIDDGRFRPPRPARG